MDLARFAAEHLPLDIAKQADNLKIVPADDQAKLCPIVNGVTDSQVQREFKTAGLLKLLAIEAEQLTLVHPRPIVIFFRRTKEVANLRTQNCSRIILETVDVVEHQVDHHISPLLSRERRDM